MTALMGFTELTPQQEQAFRAWYRGVSKLRGTNPDPDAPGHHFDYRAAYLAGWNPRSPDEHGSSEFKMPGSPERFIPAEGLTILDTIMGTLLGSLRQRPSGMTALESGDK